MSDIETFEAVIQSRWPGPPGEKAARYVGHFTDRTRTGSKIVAKVVGNHGAYTVSIAAGGGGVTSACSCYIGKGGYCHHCVALAHTFLRDPGSFREIQPTPREAVGGLPELQASTWPASHWRSSWPSSRRTGSPRKRSPKASG